MRRLGGCSATPANAISRPSRSRCLSGRYRHICRCVLVTRRPSGLRHRGSGGASRVSIDGLRRASGPPNNSQFWAPSPHSGPSHESLTNTVNRGTFGGLDISKGEHDVALPNEGVGCGPSRWASPASLLLESLIRTQTPAHVGGSVSPLSLLSSRWCPCNHAQVERSSRT
jgi:hypothetical protein